MTGMMDTAKEFGECTETFYGLYPGVAENVVDPDGKGRITVVLPWISPTYETRFCPVAQIYAGDGYGAVWIPEKGDQVVLAFLKGLLSRPIILGSIYSNVRQPALTRSNSEDPKLMRTKAGHYLLMEDKSGKRIELMDLTGKNSITIDSESNAIDVVAEGDVTVDSKANVSVVATKDVSAEAGGSITLNATKDVSINASGSVSITAGSTVSVSGSSISLN